MGDAEVKVKEFFRTPLCAVQQGTSSQRTGVLLRATQPAGGRAGWASRWACAPFPEKQAARSSCAQGTTAGLSHSLPCGP